MSAQYLEKLFGFEGQVAVVIGGTGVESFTDATLRGDQFTLF